MSTDAERLSEMHAWRRPTLIELERAGPDGAERVAQLLRERTMYLDLRRQATLDLARHIQAGTDATNAGRDAYRRRDASLTKLLGIHRQIDVLVDRPVTEALDLWV